VGNYDNDLSLITGADIGAAPAGSLPSVLNKAKWILSPCGEGAILDLIQRLEHEIDK
jgi:hydroxymethylpyrimidine pyrophosphatase-like HAD family hydrolase